MSNENMDENMNESMFSTSGEKKNSKPIMEKKRRARINSSLSELKSLLLEVMKKEGSRHTKMEKADILEMTVRHLRQIQRHQFAAAASTDPSVINKYYVGFNECANEVTRFMNSVECIDVEVRARLMNHLANCIQGLNANITSAQPHLTSSQVHHINTVYQRLQPKVGVANGNTQPTTKRINRQFIQTHPMPMDTAVLESVPSVPIRKQTGDVVFVIPGNIVNSQHPGGYMIPIYSDKVRSPGLSTQSCAVPVSVIQNSRQHSSHSYSSCESPVPSPTTSSSSFSSGEHETMKHERLSPASVTGPANENVIRGFDSDIWRPW